MSDKKNSKDEKFHPVHVKEEKVEDSPPNSPSSSGNSGVKKNHSSKQQYHPYKGTRCQKCVHHVNCVNTVKKECTCSECPKLPLNRLEQPSFPCPTCEMTFSTLHERNQHIKEHPKNCTFCGMNFHTNNELFAHVSAVHLRIPVTREPPPSVPEAPPKPLYLKNQYVLIPKPGSPPNGEPNSVGHGECSSSSSSMKKAVNTNDIAKTHNVSKQPVSGESSASRERAPEFPCDPEDLVRVISRSIRVRENMDPVLKTLANGNLGSNLPPIPQNGDPNIIEQILLEIQSKVSDPLSMVAPLTVNDLNHIISMGNTSDASSSSALSAEWLDNSDPPSLSFNNYAHLNWLIDFINKQQTVGYPLTDSTREKIAHLSSSILQELSQPTGILCIKKNFVCLVEAQKQLSDFLYNHFRCVCDLLL